MTVEAAPGPEGARRRRPAKRSTPARGNTPIHNFRIPDEIWSSAKVRAEAEETTLTAEVVAFLRRYGQGETGEANG